ncbi:MAG: hypothetical protein WDA00_07240 [Eubacteriales bacterium]
MNNRAAGGGGRQRAAAGGGGRQRAAAGEGTSVNESAPSLNATRLTGTYSHEYWKRTP